MSQLDPSKLVTTSDLELALTKAMKDHGAMLQSHESSLQAQSRSLSGLEKALMESSSSIEKFSGKVGGVEEELSKLMESLGDIEVGVGVHRSH